MDDDDTVRFDDGAVRDAVVDRLAPEEITHTLTKSPNWEDIRAGDMTVFRPTDGGQPVVYDPADRTFLAPDRYRHTLDAVRRDAVDEDGLVEMLSEVDGAVEKRDVLMHFHDTRGQYRSNYTSGAVVTIGFAVDGEGYTLARMADNEPGQHTYAVVRSTYTPDGAEREVPDDRFTVDPSDVPDRNDFFHNKIRFLDDHLLTPYSDRREEAITRIEEAYSRTVDL